MILVIQTVKDDHFMELHGNSIFVTLSRSEFFLPITMFDFLNKNDVVCAVTLMLMGLKFPHRGHLKPFEPQR